MGGPNIASERHMMKKAGRLVLVPVWALSAACASLAPVPQYSAEYDVQLSRVERQIRGGQMREFANVTGNAFEDENIKVAWRENDPQLVFSLVNKSSTSLRVLWDEVSFVGIDGKTDRVIHEGVKIADRGQSMPPTVVVRGGTLEDLIQPASNIYWRRGYGTYDVGGWEHIPLLPRHRAASEAELRTQMLDDAAIKVLLPVDINGTVYEYLFEFNVTGHVVPPQS